MRTIRHYIGWQAEDNFSTELEQKELTTRKWGIIDSKGVKCIERGAASLMA